MCSFFLADLGKDRGCSTNTTIIHSLIQSRFVKISLRRRHALIVEDGAFSHKIDYITIFEEILSLKVHPNCLAGWWTVGKWEDFAYWWSFSGEGCASAACAPGLFFIFTFSPSLPLHYEIV